ncbi:MULTISPECIES: chlorohydrolase family protein [unclassified Streptomyces]|uniref:chlorohydrolase family protein n=1 Tax=unclassified Streptomyces TaxID=2593676 RepID=UPI0003756F36|nr:MULTISPECIES: chlorohydrolase family protein [unclassified Streptomyces]MYY07070.1 amidohydrolase family protein [Streptomyces sp. SID4913]
MRTRISARFVVGHDGRDHVVHENGAVVYEDDTVIHVGHGFEGRVDVERDEGLALVGPGFVDLNALGDIDHAVFDTYQDDALATGQRWSQSYLERRHEVFSREEEAFKRRYAFGQLLLNGITTALPIASEISKEWAETYEEMADAAEAAVELGLRVYLGPSYRSAVPVVDARGRTLLHHEPRLGEAGLDGAARFVADFDGSGHGLVRGMLAPSRIETVAPALLRRTRDLGDELRCPVRLHAGQTMFEVGLLREAHGRRPIELLHDIGFLGPRTLIPHAWAVAGHSELPVPGDDLGLLSDSGTTVIFCPMAVARYAVVLESFDRYLARGIRMAMGTDTAPPDMIRAMDTGMVLTKAVERRRSAGSCRDLYHAATVGGADALGRPDLGRLAEGTRADITVVDLSGARTGPVDDPIRTLVLAANGRDVRTVVVNGRTVVDEGALLGARHDDRERAQAYLDRYRAGYTERDHLGRTERELFPPTYRIRRAAP